MDTAPAVTTEGATATLPMPGMHYSTLSGYLTETIAGRTVMNIDAIEAIADALGISLVDLTVEAQRRRQSAAE